MPEDGQTPPTFEPRPILSSGSSPRPTRTASMRFVLWGAIAATLAAVVLAGFAALSVRGSEWQSIARPAVTLTTTLTTTTTAGQRPIPLPWDKAIEADHNAIHNIVVSGDTLGLFIACAGTTAPVSGVARGEAQLWRTRDAGAHWQTLSATLPLAECSVLGSIWGRDGLFVAYTGCSGMCEVGAIEISSDAGDTWHTVSQYFSGENYESRYNSMRTAIYRNGRLYASLYQSGRIRRIFSVSDDFGLTWTFLQQTAPPASDELAVVTDTFTPDYSTPNTCFAPHCIPKRTRRRHTIPVWIVPPMMGGPGQR